MKKVIFILIILSAAVYLFAEAAKSYRVLSRFSVRDNATQLIWARCSMGENNKPIYDFNCSGSRKKYTYIEAIDACENLKFDGRSDWRLPSIKELQSLVVYYDYSTHVINTAAINQDVFPNVITPQEHNDIVDCFQRFKYDDTLNCRPYDVQYWSSTRHAGDGQFAWFVDFFWGTVSWFFINPFSWPGVIEVGEEDVIKYVRCVAGPDR